MSSHYTRVKCHKRSESECPCEVVRNLSVPTYVRSFMTGICQPAGKSPIQPERPADAAWRLCGALDLCPKTLGGKTTLVWNHDD
jgi:hypothetical protein